MIQKNRFIGRTILLLGTLLFLSSCSDSGTGPDDSGLTNSQKDVIAYFKEIALGFEFSNAKEITRKWSSDVLIYVGGEENQVLQDELDAVISELNGLISRDNVEIRITSDSTESNFYVFFGPGEEYGEVYPQAQEFIESNAGLFFVNWGLSSNNFTSGSMYVDTVRPETQFQLHLLREELTQSMGLARDSDRYEGSIFHYDFSVVVTEYSDYDEALIQLLYHPQMETGLDASAVDPILREIVGEVIQ